MATKKAAPKATPKAATPKATPKAAAAPEPKVTMEQMIAAALDLNDVLQIDPQYEVDGEKVLLSGAELDETGLIESLKTVAALLESTDIKAPPAKEGEEPNPELKAETVAALLGLGITLPIVEVGKKKTEKEKTDKPKKEKVDKPAKERDKYGFLIPSIIHNVAQMIEDAGSKGVTQKDIIAASWNERKNSYKSYWMQMVVDGHAEFKDGVIKIK